MSIARTAGGTFDSPISRKNTSRSLGPLMVDNRGNRLADA